MLIVILLKVDSLKNNITDLLKTDPPPEASSAVQVSKKFKNTITIKNQCEK